MGQSKRYKGKACAYCSKDGSSSTNDHVVARSFFLPEDRQSLPQVPACSLCNNAKSLLENYVGSTLLIGSNHAEGNRYRHEMVRPRLDQNLKLRRELNLDAPPEWVRLGGLYQPVHAVKVDASKVTRLMELIVVGLYRFHFGVPLDRGWRPDVTMFHPDREAEVWASVSDYFPPNVYRIEADLGRSSFVYAGVRSPAHPGMTAWQMAWHGGIHLHGENAPPDGIGHWWAITRPTPDAVAAAVTRLEEEGAPASPSGSTQG